MPWRLKNRKIPLKFADFEKAGWQKQIAGYDGGVGAVSRQTVQPMLDAAKVRAGVRVLDVCCGPGMLADARGQARRQGDRGSIFADVVELARTLAPAAEFQSGDAQNLPFPDNSFDALVCGYGILHVPDPEARARVFTACCVRRRIALSSWTSRRRITGLG